MSQPMSTFPTSRARSMPQGEEVASFASYVEAQAAVDALSDNGFPVQYLAIIGTDGIGTRYSLPASLATHVLRS